MQDTLSSLGCLVDDEIVLRAARVLAPSSADCTGWRALTQVPREQGGEGGAAGETMPTSAPANVAPPQAHADRAALLLVVTGIGPDRNHTCPTCCDLDPVRGFGRPHAQKHPDIGRASTRGVAPSLRIAPLHAISRLKQNHRFVNEQFHCFDHALTLQRTIEDNSSAAFGQWRNEEGTPLTSSPVLREV